MIFKKKIDLKIIKPYNIHMSEIYGIYIKSLLEKKITLSITEIGSNINEILEQKIKDLIEGKCINEGFVRPNSVRIVSNSAGLIQSDHIDFVVLFECMVTYPVEGQKIDCKSKTITKAGIHAEVMDKDIIPIHIFVAKEHNNDFYFNSIKEDVNIRVRVIGVRFELNDPYICVIGKLIDPSKEKPSDNIIKIKKKK